jgi:PHP family Zn ribbon phosphoesterase
MSTKIGTSLSLEAVVAVCSDYKGINVVGTGDCHFKPWFTELRKRFVEQDDTPGIYFLPLNAEVGFILQTEIIFTADCGGKRKQVHVIFLFPDFITVKTFKKLLEDWRVKIEAIPRPFIKCETKNEVSSRIARILEIDDMIEIIPAHIMTPTGVFGSNIRINWLEDFFGDIAYEIHAVETGLSADPRILSIIPELDKRALISNSDAHCADFHRLGREFFSIDINKLSYEAIIEAIRRNKIVRTAEFPPEEGKYFLTGHRAGKWKPRRNRLKAKQKKWHDGNEFCLFSPPKIPEEDLCPICNRTLTVGVLQRAYEISEAQGSSKRLLERKDLIQQSFRTIIPLTEVIAVSLGIKNPMAKRVISEYKKLIEVFGSEVDFWFHSDPNSKLDNFPPSLSQNLQHVHSGNFHFWLPGFDGTYGSLKIGKRRDYQNISIIVKG